MGGIKRIGDNKSALNRTGSALKTTGITLNREQEVLLIEQEVHGADFEQNKREIGKMSRFLQYNQWDPPLAKRIRRTLLLSNSNISTHQ